ncbi:unnamed protein product [Aspergillus oryzae]|uniref:Unnamed protein product n=1 Tax=Aspergillus oryzae TaxID=5062 RepID=A0AAN5C2F0_ASPOZ|nr:unnamed protein product [Aspergillus oryzae]
MSLDRLLMVATWETNATVMKLNKSTKLNPEAHLIYTLRLCTKILAKHPDLRLSNRVISILNEIDNLCKDNRQRRLANRKRKQKDTAYRPTKSFKRARMAPATQSVDLDMSRDPTTFRTNTSGDRTCPEAFPQTSGTSDDPATSRDATSHTSFGPTIDTSRNSPETFGRPTTNSHRASHGVISRPQEPTSEPSCNLISQSHATSREQAAVFDAVSREPMVTPQEPARETSSDSLTRSLDPSHNASADGENTSCAHPITVAIAIDIIHQFSQELCETPQHIYTEIVRSVQEDVQIQWSDDRSWRDIIEKSFFKAHRYVIFNLLEYIGASEWFDKQVSIAQESFLTKKHQPIKKSTAAGRVLDNIWERCNPRLNDVSSKPLMNNRDLLKLPCDKLDSTIDLILADPKLMTLLQLLSKQLEYLVNTGSTDLQTFCNGLKEHHLVPEQEIEDLLVTLRTDKGNS